MFLLKKITANFVKIFEKEGLVGRNEKGVGLRIWILEI